MSAIAHYLEDEGIATTLVALIRLHAEKTRPPRALWVPFQLGRPLGAPNNARFQRQVMEAALALLESDAGPVVLEDFPDEEPDSENRPGWQAPAGLAADDLEAEIAALTASYQQHVSRARRTTVGIGGADITTLARYLLAIDSEWPLKKFRNDLSEVQCLRYAADDMKAFYLEAVAAASEPASGWQLANWFWTETHAGELIRTLRNNSLDHPDEQRRYAAWWLVPDGWSDVWNVARMRQIEMPDSM